MKILIDINHPAHVHYFRNFIKIMASKGNKFFISSRNRDITFELLEHFNISFYNRGKGKTSRLGKLLYMFWADIQLIWKSIWFKPDIFLSFGSPYAAQTSFLLRKPHITLTDTEHADKTHKMFTYPFSTIILTPNVYYHDLGEKHFRFNNIVESLYLDERYFKPDKNTLKKLNISNDQKYALLRFVAWDAHHDFGESGLTKQVKLELIEMLKKNRYQVYISSENKLDNDFEKYRIDILPHEMHDVLAYSSLFIGESGTMASECAYLGIPSIYINSLPLMGYLKLEEDYSLLKHFNSSDGVVKYLEALLKQHDMNKEAIKNSQLMKKGFIDTTGFLVWVVDNYPDSIKIIKDKPDYQNKFQS
jgi:predicted glycosyltransferase